MACSALVGMVALLLLIVIVIVQRHRRGHKCHLGGGGEGEKRGYQGAYPDFARQIHRTK
jgi:preprotein translocase subunit SecG